jgi:phage virion morphogenesis protein
VAWNSKIDAGYVTLELSPPFERIQSDLNALNRDLDNFRTPLRESIKTVIIPSIETNFQVGGRPQWVPLSPQTVERRSRQGTGTQTLVETGALKRAATQQSRWSIEKDGASITNWPQREKRKADVHNFGAVSSSRRGRNKGSTSVIPARPFLLIQDEDADRIDDVFLDWVERRARAWWRR